MERHPPAPRFSLLRFTMVLAIAVLAFGLGRGEADAPRVLFATGMLLLAYFAGVFSPASATPSSPGLQGWLQWSALAAAITGSVLVIWGMVLRLW